MSDVLVSAEEQLDILDEVRTLIGTAIVPDPPPTIKTEGLSGRVMTQRLTN